MKNILLLFIVMFLNNPLLMKQSVAQVYSPLNSVPEWVKAKVTSEEYSLWKMMSRYYQIDYSFLAEDLSSAEKDRLYDFVREMYASIKKGEYQMPQGEQFTISMPAPIDTSLNWRICILSQIDENIRFCKQQAVIYEGKQSNNVYLECSVWYVYDNQKEKMHIIKYKVQPAGSFAEFQGSVTFYFNKNNASLVGSVSGTLQYFDKMHVFHEENLNKRLAIPLK